LGEIGSQDDFFLVGAEPEVGSCYPCLTGNILDSEGEVLFRLVRNVLVVNPGDCSRIFGDQLGYEIHDSAGNLVFKIETVFGEVPGLDGEMFATTIAGSFFDKKGNLVFMAKSAAKNERIESGVKSAFGFSKAEAFGFVQGMGEEDKVSARFALASRGAINELLTGRFDEEEVCLDGKILFDVEITNCKIRVNTGDFVFYRNCRIVNNKFELGGLALKIKGLLDLLEKGN
jgi:hypothetical protein